MGKLNEYGLLDDARKRIEALRAAYPDVVDANGNIMHRENSVDGNSRLTSLAMGDDWESLPRPVLEAAAVAAAEQAEALTRQRARTAEYMGGLRDIVTDLTRAINEAEAEIDRTDAEQATDAIGDAVQRAVRTPNGFDEDLLRELSHGGD